MVTPKMPHQKGRKKRLAIAAQPRHVARSLQKQSARARAQTSRSQHGASAVEFALIAPVLITLVLGIIDFGLYINAASVVGNAAREGVRAASLRAPASQVTTVVQEAMSDLPGAAAPGTSITTSCRTPAGATCESFTTAEPGGTAIVTVKYAHSWLTPLGLGNGISIVKASEMRIE